MVKTHKKFVIMLLVSILALTMCCTVVLCNKKEANADSNDEKTTLAVLTDRNNLESKPELQDKFNNYSSTKLNGIEINKATYDYTFDDKNRVREYTLEYYANKSDFAKNLILKRNPVNGLVIMLYQDDELQKFEKQIEVAKEAGIQSVTVYLDVNCPNRDEYAPQVESYLSEKGFDNNGSIKKFFLYSPKDGDECDRHFDDLMKFIDSHLPIPSSSTESLLSVGDTFKLPGGDIAVTGVVEKGSFAKGDSVDIVGAKGTNQKPGVKTAKIKEIQQYRKSIPSANTGDNVVFIFEGIDKEVFKLNPVVAKSSTIGLYTKVKVLVYALSEKESGCNNFVPWQWRYNMSSMSMSASGIETNITDDNICLGGNCSTVIIDLDSPIALEEGSLVTFKDVNNGRKVAIGIVTAI